MTSRPLTTAVALALALPAFTASAASDPATELDEVLVTATRTEIALRDSLSPAQVIGRAEIERSQATSLQQLLSGRAGINLTNMGGLGKQTSLFLRGMAPSWGNWGFDPRWLYAGNLVLVGGMLLLWWREYGELARQNWPDMREVLLAVAVGLAVFVLWIHLDAPWMQIGQPTAVFVPLGADGQLLWPLIVVRWLGATLLVPVMEELFWRSFLMRWLQSPVFEGIDPRRVGAKAVLLSTFVFMLAHPLWLAAIVAGLAYALLYRSTGRLWTAVIAHAVTNGALGIWVVASGQWQFW